MIIISTFKLKRTFRTEKMFLTNLKKGVVPLFRRTTRIN